MPVSRYVPLNRDVRRISGAILFAFALLTVLGQRANAQSDPPTDRNIAILQKLVAGAPNADLYYRLGDLYVQKGRQTGDITYFNLSGEALRAALKLEPRLAPAHRHLAFVLYALHNFAGAASESRAALELDPMDSYAYGVLGDAQLETGQYDQAAHTYSRMIALKPDLYSFSRRSGLETIHGFDQAAISDLKHAIVIGMNGGEPREGIAWAQVMLAQDYFLMGKLDLASGQGKAALKTFPGYHRALSILGQVHAAQGRLDEAAELYRAAIDVIPLPEYAAALSDVYAKMGRANEAFEERKLVEFIARLNKINRQLYNRVLVDYYADHDIEHNNAVNQAETEYKVRRDIYGEDALAWSLYRAGEPTRALPHIEAAIRFGTTDARLYFHAGMICAALGRSDQARRSLKHALSINPHFQPILDDVAAREYAMLNSDHAGQYAQEYANVQR
jgi:tetratricopeptide (TPR) repeat protein